MATVDSQTYFSMSESSTSRIEHRVQVTEVRHTYCYITESSTSSFPKHDNEERRSRRKSFQDIRSAAAESGKKHPNQGPPNSNPTSDRRRSHLQPESPQSAVSAPSSLHPRGRSFDREARSSVAVKDPFSDSNANSRQPSPAPSRPRILFYHRHDPHYGFTNFSPHAVEYKGKSYPTSEHLFQSLKFTHRPNLAEHIRTCDSRPSKAFSEARRFQPEVRPDWKDVNIAMMDVAILHKFRQHQDLREELLATGDAELVEDSDKDAFWGVGSDGKGHNELGKALERLRKQLRT